MTARRTARRTTRKTIAIVGMLLLPVCGGAPEPEECTDPVPATTVRLEDFAFEPDCLTAAPGAAITLENVGDAPHTFTVERTEVDLDLSAGDTAEAALSGVEPGLYAVTCTYHPQMTATLEIA